MPAKKLKIVAVSGGSLDPAVPCVEFFAAEAEVEPLRVDVAVVGGGIGGLYTAWRLSTASPENRNAPSSARTFGAVSTVATLIISS